jgi:hypothetical protein
VKATRWVNISVIVIVFIVSAHPVTLFNQSSHIHHPNPHVTADSSDPPTIEWFGLPENSTDTMELIIDGIYSGQTKETFDYAIWINDTDGVDVVIFRFQIYGQWENQTPTLIEGNETRGLYAGGYTCSIQWDWLRARPEPSGVGFRFKVFANDTLGNWRETTTYHVSLGYFVIIPPFPYVLATPFGILIIGGSLCIVGGIIRKKRKNR